MINLNLVAWIIVGGGIGWVASLVIRMDARQHAAQYRLVGIRWRELD